MQPAAASKVIGVANFNGNLDIMSVSCNEFEELPADQHSVPL